MGEKRGYLKYPRRTRSRRPAEKRIKDFSEIDIPGSGTELARQAARCMDCGIPFCHAFGCPLGNLVPEFNSLLFLGNSVEAWKRLEEINPMPEITGRVCPAPCEDACTLSINDSPVSIKDVELFLSRRAWRRGLVRPLKPVKDMGMDVAVIGSGPAGLAGAWALRRMGYGVAVFEKDLLAGGMLRWGIPDFKLNKDILDRRIDIFKKGGIKFKTGIKVGRDISVPELQEKYKALLLATGSRTPRDLNIPGRELKGIYFAMEYLRGINDYVRGIKREDGIISARGKSVLVIGGGDTGSDCASGAFRQGAASVSQAEILPRPEDKKGQGNPSWPLRPILYKKSTAVEEGVKQMWGVRALRFIGKKGNVKEVEFEKKNKEKFKFKADLVLLAMGFLHPRHEGLIKDMGIKVDDRGNIETGEGYMTSVPSIFAAGDASTGASLVVSAMESGKKAAGYIHSYLNNKKKVKDKYEGKK